MVAQSLNIFSEIQMKIENLLFLQDLFQMGATSYPGMSQPFSMSHSSNMGSVGVRQDSMGEC